MLPFILLVLALVCFVLVTFGVNPHPRVNLTGLGLALWVLSILVGSGVPT